MSQDYHMLSESDLSGSESELSSDVAPSDPLSNPVPSVITSSKSSKSRKVVNQIDKAEKLKVKEKFKHLSPASCLNYLSISVDESILENSSFNSIITEAGLLQVPIKTQKGFNDSITWIRKQLTGEYTEEPHVLILWDHIMLLIKIENNMIHSYFQELKMTKPNHRIYLMIYGLRDFCRRKRKKCALTGRELSIKITPSRDKIENILCELQLIYGISHRLFDDLMDLVTFINKITKSVGEEPYRLEKQKIEMEKTSYLQGSSRSCVKIDKQNNGMKRLWVQQLTQFPMSTVDIAKAIASSYPSPYALYRAYKQIELKDRDNMLQDIAIGREGSKKRLGPEMSKKIGLLFSKQDFVS